MSEMNFILLGLKFRLTNDRRSSIVALWESKPDNAFLNFQSKSENETIAQRVKAREVDLRNIWKPVIQNWGKAVLAL